MTRYINKADVVAEIRKRLLPTIRDKHYGEWEEGQDSERIAILDIIDTIEVKDPYEQCVQYDSVKACIQAHAETYSFNIESELFNQLTKEQQKLWRKEIEQAVISGGEVGVELAKDTRYKENLKMKEVDLEEEIELIKGDYEQVDVAWNNDFDFIARHFYELGIKAKGE